LKLPVNPSNLAEIIRQLIDAGVLKSDAEHRFFLV
jgi:hypothetical protein